MNFPVFILNGVSATPPDPTPIAAGLLLEQPPDLVRKDYQFKNVLAMKFTTQHDLD